MNKRPMLQHELIVHKQSSPSNKRHTRSSSNTMKDTALHVSPQITESFDFLGKFFLSFSSTFNQIAKSTNYTNMYHYQTKQKLYPSILNLILKPTQHLYPPTPLSRKKPPLMMKMKSTVLQIRRGNQAC